MKHWYWRFATNLKIDTDYNWVTFYEGGLKFHGNMANFGTTSEACLFRLFFLKLSIENTK